MFISDPKFNLCVCTHTRWAHWYDHTGFIKCIESACFCPEYRLDNLKYLEKKAYEKSRKSL